MHDLARIIGKRIREIRNAQGIRLEELSFKARQRHFRANGWKPARSGARSMHSCPP